MRLLLTRPREDSDRLAARLRALGHEAVIAPLMDVHMREGCELSLAGIQAILATSGNGVRAIAGRTGRRDVPLYAVGPQTADTARAYGFALVVDSEGDAAALADRVAATLDPKNGVVFHTAGAETAGRLRQVLEARGFQVQSEILYEAVAVERLPDMAIAAIKNEALDGVMVFSPRSASILAMLVTGAQLEGKVARLDAFCISAATAAALAPLAFARIAVASAPNEAAMLALLAPPGGAVAS